MTYENGKQYKGVYGGVSVTFRLVNFSEKVVERFNKSLAEEAMKNEKLVGRSAVGVAATCSD
jgi:hypothetical protein